MHVYKKETTFPCTENTYTVLWSKAVVKQRSLFKRRDNYARLFLLFQSEKTRCMRIATTLSPWNEMQVVSFHKGDVLKSINKYFQSEIDFT